jgi:hypothetical protein
MKKRARWILWLFPIAVLSCALYWKTHQPEYVLQQFMSRQSGRLSLETTDAAAQHLYAMQLWQKRHVWPDELPAGWKRQRPLLLRVSWYQRENALIEGGIDIAGGLIQQWLLGHDDAYGNSPHHFSNAELKEVQSFVHQFPVCISPTPSVEHVLFISYRDGEDWKARVYDRRYLPEPVREVLRLLTARAGGFLKTEKPEQNH